MNHLSKAVLLAILSFLGILQACQVAKKGKGEARLPEAIPPPGYRPVFIKQTKNLSALGNQPAQVRINRIEVKPNLVRLYVNISDTLNTLYTDAAAQRKLWCLLTDSLGGKKEEIKEYKLLEWKEEERRPMAIALVMDHSGSMGDDRAKAAQKAVADFLRQSKEEDAFTLIKYDQKVITEVALTTNKQEIIAKLEPPTGLKAYGGYTALLDGTQEALRQLGSLQGYEHKAVIVFTDGKENSSTASKDSVIALARRLQIPVCAFDFGAGIQEGYLEALALPTGGSYQRVYTTPELNDVFVDIYKRIRNNYIIELKPTLYGEHHIRLKICLPQGALEAEAVYDNTPDVGTAALLNINFDTNKWDIKPASKEALDNVLRLLKSRPTLQIALHGHTDNVGDDAKNMELSQKRANAVKDYLVKQGIEAGRIVATGFGEEKPIATNDTPAGRALNRRTEFVILKK
jgi:outer membrane protein OmpA-like peptidoglycan-associated protein/Mg-chelatase subunit ChlD